jgi:hypothetical protein
MDDYEPKSKEEFQAELDSLVVEGEAIVKSLHEFGVRLAKAGMLASGAVEAYLGMKATVFVLNGLKDGSIIEEIEQKLAQEDAVKEMESNPHLNKYLN